jgi:hypothetical protein
VRVTIAGRDGRRAAQMARALGPEHRSVQVDLADIAACLAAVQGQHVAVNCVGPLSTLGPTLLEACLAARCHYVDIAVERANAALVRSWDERLRHARLTAAYGCSSMPALSVALALTAHDQPFPPERVRVALLIGNDNRKARGAIQSLLTVLGHPIATRDGPVRGFGDREVVPFPAPFGPRAVFNFDSPDHDLLPTLLGVKSVAVKVGFELALVTHGLALVARMGIQLPERFAAFFERVGNLGRGIGSSGGAIVAELFYSNGGVRRHCLLARNDGQRMAALPCALAASALCQGPARVVGCTTGYELLGPARLLQQVSAGGFEILQCHEDNGSAWARHPRWSRATAPSQNIASL